MAPPAHHPSRRTTPSRSPSRSPSPDPELVRFLNEQKRPHSPDSEAFRKQRIAAAGVLNVKSRHQKEKEESERRRLEEEENAAKAYREFVLDMQGGGGGSSERKRGFVRAGGSSSYATNSRSSPPSYAPHRTIERCFTGGDDDFESGVESNTTRKREPPGKRKGAMNDFLGELQRDQAIREERLRPQVWEGKSISTILAEEGGGSSKPWDSPDPSSTNVCILNLPANVNETIFGEHFSNFGDIGSVKIMWSRATTEAFAPSVRTTRTPGSTGFINFMNRADAVRAYREIEDTFWMGSQLKVGWGKPLRKPAQPLICKSREERYAREGDEATNRDSTLSERRTRRSRSPGSRNHRRERERQSSPISLLRFAVLQEGGEETEKKIVEVSLPAKSYGRGYEEMMEKKEAGNPLFYFLRQRESIGYQYYRALIGDNIEPNLPSQPFRDDGEASLYSSDSEEDSEWERLKAEEQTKVLGKAARRRLEAMLRGITLRRERIARVMLFAIEHASAAEVVTNIIIDSLLQPGTSLSRKLARLYVVSDILHNSSVSASNAWRYRSLFEVKLDRVFLHWGDVANSFNGRIKRESCKEMARNTLNVWENWLVYEGAKLNTWRDYLESGSSTSKERMMIDDDDRC